jgi:hypothetical protein
VGVLYDAEMRSWDDSNLSDELKLFHVSDEMMQLASWRLMSEVLRCHSSTLDLFVDYYPTGSPMLSLINGTNQRQVSLNAHGSLHFFGDSGLDMGPIMPWLEIVRNGLQTPRRTIEMHLGVEIGRGPDSANPKTVGPRAIAAFLGIAVFTNKSWMITPLVGVGFEDSPVRHMVEKIGSNWPSDSYANDVLLPHAWVIYNHKHEVHGVVTSNGFAAIGTGPAVNLLEVYRSSKSNIAKVVAQLIG